MLIYVSLWRSMFGLGRWEMDFKFAWLHGIGEYSRWKEHAELLLQAWRGQGVLLWLHNLIVVFEAVCDCVYGNMSHSFTQQTRTEFYARHWMRLKA